ncbi:Alpha/Beta hydrolase protein [Collybia nuda]|uniref:Alpha/Beta hydrolase protein n=1 Tax=Collybia nuda TaxID=64659 RepID=A0A9P5Y2M1_9AGAR|nr:Alpha/Beta hydrolase protein [Collybia nuda]
MFRIKDIIDPSYPLLEANRTTIESIPRETFTYGPTERHKLDVYHSTLPNLPTKPPILVFFYGGGFTSGERSSQPSDLVHNNLGAFFASKGIITVIPDYRLVPSIVFPEGSEDIRDAMTWVVKNLSEGIPNRVSILAHSAGGIHVAGMLFTPSLFPSTVASSVRGVALLGVPYELSNYKRPRIHAASLQYYGNLQNIAANQPLGLLRRADKAHIASLPHIRNMRAESEPRVISGGVKTLTRLVGEKGGTIEECVLEGHDHLSPILSLSCGSGEEWGDGIVEWINSTGG